MNIAKYYNRLFANEWMMHPQSFAAMLSALLHLKNGLENPLLPQAGLQVGPPPMQQPRPAYSLDASGVATIQMHGVMAMRPDSYEQKYLGMVCMEETGNAVIQAVSDPKVRAIMLDFDSPGGSANGTPELAQIVSDASERKPVVSYTDTMQCSAAYYVGSQANAVLAAPSAYIGNVGTVISYMDLSKMLGDIGAKMEVIHNDDSPLKGMGTFGTALNKDHKAFLQQVVNDSAATFKQAVSSKRQCPAEAMDGGWYSGQRAMGLKLADQLCDRRTALKTAAQLAR